MSEQNRLEGSSITVSIEFAAVPDEFTPHEWRLVVRGDYPDGPAETHPLASGRCYHTASIRDQVDEALAVLRTKAEAIAGFFEAVAYGDTSDGAIRYRQATQDKASQDHPVC